MMRFFHAFLIAFLAIMILFGTFMAGYWMQSQTNPVGEFPILKQAHDILLKNGFNTSPTAPALEYGMIRGMLQAYNDPYTVFVEPPQHEIETNNLQGRFGGIGVQLGNDPGGEWLLYPFPESPAQKAGVMEGDRLLAVDDLPIRADTPVDVIQAAIRGKVGSKVRLSLARPPEYQAFEVSIEREEIPLPSVTWHIEPGHPEVGVIKINMVASSTPDEVQKAAKDLATRGAKYYILDLRDNPGGLLEAGIDVARLFLKEGVILEQQYREKDVESFRVEKPGSLKDLPLAVLINQGSASAAEVIAGALQAHQHAPLIGVPSYGKDSIQLVFDLQDGSSLHVTSAHWWIPGLEKPINEGGLQPDLLISPDESVAGNDRFVQEAIRVLTGLHQ